MECAFNLKTSMPNSEPIIQCSNPHCLTFNLQENRLCSKCKTPIMKRYLWATAEAIAMERVGELIGDRYLAVERRIFLDTKPGIPPQTPQEIPPQIAPYLLLFPYFPHIPQIYGQLDGTDVWLLEYGTVPAKKNGNLMYSQFIPELTTVWQKATSLKQLNLLLQIAQLWQPMQNQAVVSSLLDPWLLRVNGSFLQLLQLQSDKTQATKPSLKQLGQLWSQWIPHTASCLQEFLRELSQQLIAGSIDKPIEITAVLNKAIALCGKSQEYSYQVFALSDSGPNRFNNEDASYPNHQKIVTTSTDEKTLAIVCDGVGGHEGGEIASQETIDYLQQKIDLLTFDEGDSNPKTIFKQLAQFTNEANDAISQRNDSERRQERQRMGTTLVMALAKAYEVYLTHVGDSRIYCITRTGCHQVTTDDDLASREVRLGYAVYREALQYPSAGALIQALGMRDSAALHPNIRRFVIDQDCIFLLCSDGLSDFERVEQYWRSSILPVLFQKGDLTKAAKTLMKIANERNGHDNATVALVHCQISQKPEKTKTVISWSEISSVLAHESLWAEVDSSVLSLPPTQKVGQTQTVESGKKSKPPIRKTDYFSIWKIIVAGLLFLIGTGLISYFILLHLLRPQQNLPEPSSNQSQEKIFTDGE